ncbi:MAG TPA: hypothetical protein PKJ33_02970 [Alphaproteobacteria bacterium]|nr:hypothetical protein [Alphaproteobacteria bacterium]
MTIFLSVLLAILTAWLIIRYWDNILDWEAWEFILPGLLILGLIGAGFIFYDSFLYWILVILSILAIIQAILGW